MSQAFDFSKHCQKSHKRKVCKTTRDFDISVLQLYLMWLPLNEHQLKVYSHLSSK